ncbi:MAG: hypothetical protein AAB035_04625 [Nitrospirota bacterium]
MHNILKIKSNLFFILTTLFVFSVVPRLYSEMNAERPLQNVPETIIDPREVVGIRLSGSSMGGVDEETQSLSSLLLKFGTGKSSMMDANRDTLKAFIQSFQPNKIERIEVMGYPDSQGFSPIDPTTLYDRDPLPLDRANEVAKNLSQLGIAMDRIWVSGSGANERFSSDKDITPLSKNSNAQVHVYTGRAQQSRLPHLSYHVDVDGGAIFVKNLRVKVSLPQNFRIVPDTVRLDGVPMTRFIADQEVVVFSLSDVGVQFQRRIDFDAAAVPAVVQEQVGYERNRCASDRLFRAEATAFFHTETIKDIDQKTVSVENELPCVASPSLKDKSDRLVRIDSVSKRNEIFIEQVR